MGTLLRSGQGIQSKKSAGFGNFDNESQRAPVTIAAIWPGRRIRAIAAPCGSPGPVLSYRTHEQEMYPPIPSALDDGTAGPSTQRTTPPSFG
jgi:hypothetical protein